MDDWFLKSYTENNTYSGTNESITKEGMCMQQIYFRLQESMELKKGEKIQLVGFGTFETSERAAREGRNPSTGETMKIEACKAPKFKAGKALKDAVNE